MPRPLTQELILGWVDEHHQQQNEWPRRDSGPIDFAPGETWSGIDAALKMGNRGLPGGSSLAQLLAEQRGVRNSKDLPPLTEEWILAWADAFHTWNQQWPTRASGEIEEAPGESWATVNNTLVQGGRGLPGGSSLAQLLAERRGVRNIGDLLSLTEERILTWADRHQERTREWPRIDSGPIVDAPGETWGNVDAALCAGTRGLSGGSSLPQLLAEQRGGRNIQGLPALIENQMLAWADAHFERTGKWPTQKSGPIAAASGESWGNIDQSLRIGIRGLSGGSSLAQLLAKERGVRNKKDLARLTVDQILAWADEHRQRTSVWPNRDSGPIPGRHGETWGHVDTTLRRGGRGLSGGSSLCSCSSRNAECETNRQFHCLPRTRFSRGLMRIFNERESGHEKGAGGIVDAPGETWSGVDAALKRGSRGLPGGSSLAQLLASERGVRSSAALPPLTKDQILAWVDAHFARTGQWPKIESGPILDAPGETWANIHAALSQGQRGLPRGSSLARLLAKERGARNRSALPPLTKEQILAWADAHHNRTGEWPAQDSGTHFRRSW